MYGFGRPVRLSGLAELIQVEARRRDIPRAHPPADLAAATLAGHFHGHSSYPS
ncbi:hypothetical protein SPHINGOT1_120434 [Sphingomonas sp. T1]|nr:hypothetical protein SPHINGOT1_120434 [Sphingomonas sp. T1]